MCTFFILAETEPVVMTFEECDDDHEVEDDDAAHDAVAEVEHDLVLFPISVRMLRPIGP